MDRAYLGGLLRDYEINSSKVFVLELKFAVKWEYFTGLLNV
jgi:hypothetical protein